MTFKKAIHRHSYTYTCALLCDNVQTQLIHTHVHYYVQGSGIRLGHRGEYYHNDTENMVHLQMVETSWRHTEGSTSARDTLVPRDEFMIVLADVDRLLVRVTYHLYQTHAM